MSCGLRDVLGYEEAGRPSVLVSTVAFAQAADEQARLLGAPDLARVLLAHPIQDRTDDEMHALARGAADELLAALSGRVS